jgi:hypothetical protein
MICRVATYEKRPDVPQDRLEALRAWMKSQPGMKAHYHVYDPETDSGMSISFWESAEHLAAMKDRTPPGGPMGLKPSSVSIFPVVVES